MIDTRVLGVIFFVLGLTYFVEAIVTEDIFRSIIAFLVFIAAILMILEPDALERKEECCEK